MRWDSSVLETQRDVPVTAVTTGKAASDLLATRQAILNTCTHALQRRNMRILSSDEHGGIASLDHTSENHQHVGKSCVEGSKGGHCAGCCAMILP